VNVQTLFMSIGSVMVTTDEPEMKYFASVLSNAAASGNCCVYALVQCATFMSVNVLGFYACVQ
jgi:hypothetical protein